MTTVLTPAVQVREDVLASSSDPLPLTHPEGQHRMCSVTEGSRSPQGVASRSAMSEDLRL